MNEAAGESINHNGKKTETELVKKCLLHSKPPDWRLEEELVRRSAGPFFVDSRLKLMGGEKNL